MLQIIEKEVLDALIDGAKVAGERAIFFPAEGDEPGDKITKTVISLGNPRLRDFAQLQIEIRKRAGISDGGEGGCRHGRERNGFEAKSKGGAMRRAN